MVQKNGYKNFNAYSRKMDVIKPLRYTNKIGTRRMHVKFRRVRAKQHSECVSVVAFRNYAETPTITATEMKLLRYSAGHKSITNAISISKYN